MASTIAAPLTRECRYCGETKPLDEFVEAKRCFYGRSHRCKACRYRDTKRWRENNLERARVLSRQQDRRRAIERERARSARVPPDPNPPAERQCRWCGKAKPFQDFEPSTSCRYGRGYRCKECKARYRAGRALSLDVSGMASLAKRRGANVIEPVSALVVLERDDGVCGICGEDVDPFNFHVDHLVPCSAGGDHSYDNVQLAHPACNVNKSHTEDKAYA